MTSIRPKFSQIWKRLSWPDLAAICFAVLGAAASVAGVSGGLYSFAKFVGLLSAGYLAFRGISWSRNRLSWPDLAAICFAVLGADASVAGVSGGLYSFAKFVGLLSAGYLAFRGISWSRNRLLWSLRNRLIVAYLFIAMVPVLLLLTLAILAGQIFYSQLGGYLLYEDIHNRLGSMADSAANIAGAEKTLPASIPDKVVEEALDAQIRLAYAKQLPGLKIEFHADPKRLVRVAGANAKEFTGILQSGGQTHLIAMREVESPRGRNLVELSVRVTPEFLETVAPD